MDRKCFRPAFTLLELLVVIGIIGVLVGITIPAVQKTREAARRTQCSNHLHQIALATFNYESSHQHLPSGRTPGSASVFGSSTWLQHLLPYIDQNNVWDQAVQDYQDDPNPFLFHSGMQTIVAPFQCNSDPDSGTTHFSRDTLIVASTSYLGVNGTDYLKRDGIFFLSSKTRLRDISDGQSNTLLIGERPPSADFWYGWWYAGQGQNGSGSPDFVLGVQERNDVPISGSLSDCPAGPFEFSPGEYGRQCDTLHFWSYHPGGANFAFGDGSVKFMPYSASVVMPVLATKAGGNISPDPFE